MNTETHELMRTRGKGRKPRRGVIKKCQQCGTEYYVSQFTAKTSKFCSRACHFESMKGSVTLQCLTCGKDYVRSPSMIRLRGSKFCSKKCRGKHISMTQSGENSPWWRGGKSKELKRIRASARFADWRKQVFERDDYTCQMCGKRGGYLEPDHIKPFAYFPELRFELSNGRTLCQPCHRKTDTWGKRAQMKYGEAA